VTNKVKNEEAQKRQQLLILGGIALAVVAIVGVIIALQFGGTNLSGDYAGIAQERLEDGGFVLGDPDAPITIVAFEDFLCSHCQTYQQIVKEFIDEHVRTGEARFEFRMLPISQQSSFVFGMVECAEILEPGSFWQAHDMMFNITSTTGFDTQTGRDFTSDLGIPYGEMLDCVRDDADQYRTDQQLASQYRERITGTPSVVWRDADGNIRLDGISRQPNNAQLSSLVEANQ